MLLCIQDSPQSAAHESINKIHVSNVMLRPMGTSPEIRAGMHLQFFSFERHIVDSVRSFIPQPGSLRHEPRHESEPSSQIRAEVPIEMECFSSMHRSRRITAPQKRSFP